MFLIISHSEVTAMFTMIGEIVGMYMRAYSIKMHLQSVDVQRAVQNPTRSFFLGRRRWNYRLSTVESRGLHLTSSFVDRRFERVAYQYLQLLTYMHEVYTSTSIYLYRRYGR